MTASILCLQSALNFFLIGILIRWGLFPNIWTDKTILRDSLQCLQSPETEIHNARPAVATYLDVKLSPLFSSHQQRGETALVLPILRRVRSKRDGTHAETKFRLSPKRTSPFKSVSNALKHFLPILPKTYIVFQTSISWGVSFVYVTKHA